MTAPSFDRVILHSRDTSWMEDVPCAYEGNWDLWFPELPSNNEASEVARYNREVAMAQAICAECPVRQRCYDDAVSRDERHGIWGGVNFHQSRPYKPKEKVA